MSAMDGLLEDGVGLKRFERGWLFAPERGGCGGRGARSGSVRIEKSETYD